MRVGDAKKAAETEIKRLIDSEKTATFYSIEVTPRDGFRVDFRRDVESSMSVSRSRLKAMGKPELEAHIENAYRRFLRG